MTQNELQAELERVAKEFPELERLAVRYRIEAGNAIQGGPYEPCWIVAQFAGKDIVGGGATFDKAMAEVRYFLKGRKRDLEEERSKMNAVAASA